MAMAIGDRGNAGVIPIVVEEAFNYLAESISANSPGRLYSYRTVAAAAVAATAAKAESLFRVTISAALLRDGTYTIPRHATPLSMSLSQSQFLSITSSLPIGPYI
jgi:hypothetical protein